MDALRRSFQLLLDATAKIMKCGKVDSNSNEEAARGVSSNIEGEKAGCLSWAILAVVKMRDKTRREGKKR